jgi:Ca2+-binding EF-hand superfamily protein
VLDTDRDGKLSKKELLAAPSGLEALDRDEDDLVTFDELLRAVSIDGAPGLVPRRGGASLLSVSPHRPAGPLVKTLLAAYDHDRDGRLTPGEFAVGAKRFRGLDRDGDRRLDSAELQAWFDLPPDTSVVVPLEEEPVRSVEVLSGTSGAWKTHGTRDGVSLLSGGHAIEFRRAAGPTRPARVLLAPPSPFETLDKNGDGYLDQKEVQTPPFTYVSWLRLADRDGDGRISRKEFDSFAGLQRRVKGAATFVRIESQGASLFRLLDADGDGTLGPRERRSAWQRVAGVIGGKVPLTLEQLPEQFRVTMRYGEALPDDEPDVRVTRLQGRTRGPLWFRKMDRNGDGDVSSKEWLGTAEDFKTIDSDGDGLIGVEEAEASDRKMRR